VGSKEGWAPKTFVSSRSNRNKDQVKSSTQRPEDFMDEEDLAEAAEARQLETAQEFAAVGGSGKSGSNDGFFGLFVADEDTIGVKILQKMGWRRDQGIGRKVRRAADLDDDGGRHLFAPKDTRTVSLVGQDARKGLGYQSEARLSKAEEDSGERPLLALPFLDRNSKSQPVKKAKPSFGVGVLNDTGSDDEDPYELGPKIIFNKTLGKEKKVKKPSKFAKAIPADKPVFISKKGAANSTEATNRTSQDGRPLLRGFTFAIQVSFQPTKVKYPPPNVPAGWKSSKGASVEVHTQPAQSVADAAKSSSLNANARASLLGETPLPGKSVFDFLSKDSRDRIAALTGNTSLPLGLGQSAPEGYTLEGKQDLWSFVPKLDKSTAAAALAKGASGWMPYSEDTKKRARYIGLLELCAGIQMNLPERPPGMSVSEWAKELGEFAHAAEVFKPTSGLMASRFTSAGSSIQLGASNNKEGDNLLRTATAKPEDPAEQAAKMGMYGPMTRSVFPFQPTRLLCKRFNVALPPDVPFASETNANDYTSRRTHEAVSQSVMHTLRHEVLTKGPAMLRPAWMDQTTHVAPEGPATPPVTSGHATVNVEHNEALAMDRAPDDVFRAVFGDEEEEDE
jgi:G patch domain-containing protein 1